MKRIKLTQGQYALVDDADFGNLSEHKWYASKSRYSGYYAYRECPCWIGNSRENRRVVLMHKQIMKVPKGKIVDHVNHSALDNQRGNLRVCTYSQNSQNYIKRQKGSSAFKGVCWSKIHQKWLARITVNGKRRHLGFFASEIKAALAYEYNAIKYFGEFACAQVI